MMKMKQILCLLLAMLMLCGTLVGCGDKKESSTAYTDDENEEVTLTIALPIAKQKDAEKVIAEINKKLETLLPNTKIDILFDSEMSSKWTLWMATKKEIDLAHSGFATDIEAEVEKSSYLKLDDLIEEYAPTLKEHRDEYWHAYDSGVISGNLYAVPNVQCYLKEVLAIEFKEASDYVDAVALKEESWSTDKTTEKFWQIVDEGLDNAAKAGVDLKGKIGTRWYEVAKKGYHFIGGANSNLCYDNSADAKVIDFYTTDEFKTFCKYMKIWADKGYVSPDVITSNASGYRATKVNTLNLNQVTGESDGLYVIENPNKVTLTTSIGYQGTYWSVPFTSNHPARAIKFLDLIHSEEGAEIVNLLAYGIEGEHYEFVDKEHGDIDAFEYDGQGGSEVSYGIPNWYISNMMQGMYYVDPYTHIYGEHADDYYLNRINKFEKHVLYGFTFDTSIMKTQLSNILKNNSELAKNVYTGVVDNSDSLLNELLSKNKAAGQEDVIKELQKQADEYIASK